MLKKAQRIVYYQDPGHGWLQVPLELINAAKIKDRISSCSFVDRSNLMGYLEEDCDALLFVSACEAKGIELEIVERVEPKNESWIRGLLPWGSL